MRKILITGGAGFIGSALVRYIINETSDAVVVVDKLTYAGNLMSLARSRKASALPLRKLISAIGQNWRAYSLSISQPVSCIWQPKAMLTVLLTARQRLLKPTLSGLIHCLKRRGLTGMR